MTMIQPPDIGRNRSKRIYALTAAFACVLMGSASRGEASETAAPAGAGDKTVVAAAHAQGVQIYECKAGSDGKLGWQFREPLATLMIDGKTVGRQFAGPGWEFEDGSRIKGKVASQTPGASEKDIPNLRLEVIEHQGAGRLSEVSEVLREHTNGGVFSGSCDQPGALHLEPYDADYTFLK